MADTLVLISAFTVGAGGSTTIDFTSIPGTYNDLMLHVSARSVRAQTQDGMNMKFNGSTDFATYYAANIGTILQSAGGGGAPSVGSIVGSTATASTFSNHWIYISNYTVADWKPVLVNGVRPNNSATVFETDQMAKVWSSNSTVTTITLYNDNSNFAQYTTAYLYGISNS